MALLCKKVNAANNSKFLFLKLMNIIYNNIPSNKIIIAEKLSKTMNNSRKWGQLLSKYIPCKVTK